MLFQGSSFSSSYVYYNFSNSQGQAIALHVSLLTCINAASYMH